MMDEFIFGCLCLVVIFFVYGVLLPALMIAIPAYLCLFMFDFEFRRAVISKLTLKRRPWRKGRKNE